MAAQQNFRSALNGFNREDVAHYLEYINTKHTNQINQLTAENEELRSRLAQQPEEDQQALIESLQAECAALNARIEELLAQKEQVLAEAAAVEPVVVAAPVDTSAELEAYRRAERAEREAKERAELVF